MKDRLTVFASAFSPMLQYVAKQGVELKRLFARADLNYKAFQAPNSRFTIAQSDHITQQAVLLTQCENLCLLSGQFIVPGNWNIVGYLMMNCHTLGEAFEKYCTYERVVSERNNTEMRIEDDLAVLDLQLVADTDVTIKQHSENIMSCFVTFMRILTGTDIQLTKVRFIHETSKAISDYQRIFRAPLIFEQPNSALLLEKK